MDQADIAQESEALYLARCLGAQARAAALAEPGSGICTDCGEPIPAARRRALPSARRCLDCQSFIERVRR
jgi:phage/conjugal plasmid C-4 type zinc finger TraR family protein